MGGAHVLVLDDEEKLRSTLVEFLHEHGYETSCAPDSRSGVELAMLESPDIILLDIDLPRVNGLDAIPALQHVAPSARIIVITGNTAPDLADRTFRQGGFDFLQKPLDYHALGQSLDSALMLGAPSA